MNFSKTILKTSAVLLGAALLGACTMGQTPAPAVDLGAVQTQAFNVALTEVALNQAQTAMAIPSPTNTLEPSPTFLPTFASIGGAAETPSFVVNTPFSGFTPLALPTTTAGALATITTKNGCNDGQYIGETGPAKIDWEVLERNKDYAKAWTILNTGTCAWDEGYAFVLMPSFSNPAIKWETTSIVIKKNDEVTQPQHSQSFVVKFKTPSSPGRYEGYWKLHDDAKNYFGPMVWIKFEIK